MAEYALLTPTPVAAGESVPYNTTIINGCPCIRHRNGSGVVRVKGGTYCKPNKYNIQFHGNVTGVTGTFQIGIYLDGELLPESVINGILTTATDVISVNTATEIAVDGCMSSVSVRNIVGTGMTFNTANIIVHREVA